MLKNTDYKELKEYAFNFLSGVVVILFYYLSQYLTTIPLELLNINIDTMSYTAKTIYLILFQMFILMLMLLVYKTELVRQWRDFKENKHKYFKEYFKFWFLLLGGMMLANYIIMQLNNGQIAENEQGIRDVFSQNPIYVYMAGVVIAPIVEEIVFRYSLRKLIKNNTLFIICSGLLFGLSHVIGQTDALIDYLYIIPYSIPGFVFAYILVKSDNVLSSISMHMFHNGILIALQFITYLFG